MSFVVSEADIQAYREDGVVCLRGVLTPSEIHGMREAITDQISTIGTSKTAYDFEAIARQLFQEDSEELNAGNADRFDLVALKEIVSNDEAARPLREDGVDGNEGMFFYEVGGWKAYRAIRDVALDSAMPPILAELMGSSRVHFWEDTTFVKSPNTAQKTPFHQDLSYFQTEGSMCAIVWMPLDAADLENGVTRYIRGSHKWGKIFAPSVFVSQTTTRESPYPRLPDIENAEEDYDIVSFNVEPGDIVVHDVLTVHGAGGNPTNRPRRAISFRYCGDDVRFFDRPGAIPQVYTTHNLKNGDRLDCEDYPVVWPKPWPSLKLADVYDAYAINESGV